MPPTFPPGPWGTPPGAPSGPPYMVADPRPLNDDARYEPSKTIRELISVRLEEQRNILAKLDDGRRRLCEVAQANSNSNGRGPGDEFLSAQKAEAITSSLYGYYMPGPGMMQRSKGATMDGPWMLHKGKVTARQEQTRSSSRSSRLSRSEQRMMEMEEERKYSREADRKKHPMDRYKQLEHEIFRLIEHVNVSRGLDIRATKPGGREMEQHLAKILGSDSSPQSSEDESD